MKKTLSILMVAFTMTAMVACNKDKDNEDSPLNIANNTLVYDGQTYTFDHVVVDYYHSQLTLMGAFTDDTLENGSPKLMVQGIHIMPEVWNNSFDLADATQYPDGVMVSLHLYGVVEMTFEMFNNGGNTGGYGTLDGQEYENESIFSSGTYSVSGNGVLKNGKTLKMKLVSDNYPLGPQGR